MREMVRLGWLLPLRLLAGVILLFDGWSKLQAVPKSWLSGEPVAALASTWLASKTTYAFFLPVVRWVHDNPRLFGTVTTVGELVAGGLLAVGLFSRHAAFVGALLLAVFALGAGQGLTPPGSALLLAVVCLTLVFTAPGRVLGLDQALRGKLPAWLV